MLTNRPVRSTTPRGLMLGLILGLTLTLSAGGPARGQILMDPYNGLGLYQSQYLPYIYATEPQSGSFFPNQGRLAERPALSANQFRRELADIEDSDDLGDLGSRREFGSSRTSGPGVPYYRAHHQYDQRYQREYRPNAKADASFYEEQDRQNDQYFRAQQEKDPKKRAKLLRQFSLERLQSSRQLSGGRTQAAKSRFDAKSTDRFEPLDDSEESDARPAARTVPRPRPSIRDEDVDDAPLDSSRRPGDRTRPAANSSRTSREPTVRDRLTSPFPSSVVPRPGVRDRETDRLGSPRLPGGLPESLGRPRSSTTAPRATPRAPGTATPSRSTSRTIDDILERSRRAREGSPPARPDRAAPANTDD